MISAAFAHILLIAIIVLSVALMLTRPRGIREVYWIGAGTLLLLVLRLVPLHLAAHAVAEGADVYFFLIGMMLLSELAKEHGVFDWLASIAVRHARGSRTRLFLLVYGVGTAVTVFMSNDATAVVLTPALLTAVRKARVAPMPYLFACAFIANAASFVLPISNPANLVVFHSGMPSLGQWLAAFAVPSVISIIATFAVLRWIFRHELCGSVDGELEDHPLNANGKLVVAGLAVIVAVLLVVSALHIDLGLPTLIASLAIAALVSWKARANPIGLANEISWETIALVGGLFVMVDAAESVGALNACVVGLHHLEGMTPAWAAMIAGIAVAVGNNLVNNLPLGLIAGATIHATHTQGLLAHAILIGVDLGPNLSVTGSLATILWLIALRKEKIEVSFWDFLKVGVVAMPIALIGSIGAAILMNALVGSK